MSYEIQIEDILESGRVHVSSIKPSNWTEENMIMQKPFPGPFKYSRTPYTREIIDCFSPEHPAKIVAVMKGAQVGYALDILTPIPTPKGWILMRDIKVGDEVFDENGEVCLVTGISQIMENHTCFNVEFSDGSKITADKDHLWTVWDEKKWESRRLVTINTEEIKKTFKHRKVRNRYAINVCGSLKLPEVELPIDPYLLGVWLGDGTSKSNSITCHIHDASEYIESFKSAEYNTIVSYKEGNSCTLRIRKPEDRCARGHLYPGRKIAGKNVCYECAKLRRKGCLPEIKYERIGEVFEKLNLYNNKHIPKSYLRASHSQRQSLLQGLMDTDGSITKYGKCEFYNLNKTLIDDVYELIISLGLKAKIRYRPGGKIVNVKPEKGYVSKGLYIINFYGFAENPIFKLNRKRTRLQYQKDTRESEITRRRIVSVTQCESVPVKCITVSSQSKLFLAGKSMIPTHNSSGVIYPAVGWIMKNQPGNTLLMVGHDDLVEETMNKIDLMIDSCGLRKLIRPSVQRNKAGKTGDTNTKKEFPNGYLVVGSANNHKVLRQRDMQYGIIDDFEAVKRASKESGNTRKLIEQRFAAYADKMKLFYISTPELKQTSNIEPAYLLGDQRKFVIPCPCCGEYIELLWTVPIEGSEKDMGGIYWKKDERGKLIPGTVGYICQKCGDFFDDKNKHELLNAGYWKPTAEPSRMGYYSYHLSSLYAPAGMYDWEHYALNWEEAHPEGQQRDEGLYKSFVNLCLGETYEAQTEAPKANELQKNVRNYEIGVIPEKLSQNDGNGQIVLLTCACDLNGTVDDARLDYEIVAWSESGSSYSILHGSIGTFVPREGTKKHKEDRERWTYEFHRQNSVWSQLNVILDTVFMTDTGRKMKIFISGIDCGHYTNFAYHYIDNTNYHVVGLKGKDNDKYIRFGIDMPNFKPAKERSKLFLVEVNQIKDDLADLIKLKYDEGNDDFQPPGFMNFPTPSAGLYLFKNFFSHYEAEHRIIESKEGQGIASRWEKKSSIVMNHMWDVRVYNIVLKEILVSMIGKEAKEKTFGWNDYVNIVLAGSKS